MNEIKELYAEIATIAVTQASLLQRGGWMAADELREAVSAPNDLSEPALRSTEFSFEPLGDAERTCILAEAERRARLLLADEEGDDGQLLTIDNAVLTQAISEALKDAIDQARGFDYQALQREAEERTQAAA